MEWAWPRWGSTCMQLEAMTGARHYRQWRGVEREREGKGERERGRERERERGGEGERGGESCCTGVLNHVTCSGEKQIFQSKLKN